MAGLNGISAYQKTEQLWNKSTVKGSTTEKNTAAQKNQTLAKADAEIKTSVFKPINPRSSLVPSEREGIGMAIGDVELSDKAKDYYNKLKSKFGNMDFICVSKDMMGQVKANAAAYGNANKTVVLIDENKLELMANDESFRKKYEGIIEMAQSKLMDAKNSLASSGANIQNFGMTVNEDGTTSFFATLKKSSENQEKRIAAKKEKDKAEKVKEKKLKEKKAAEKHKEKVEKEKKSAEKIRDKSETSETDKKESVRDREYVKIESNSIEDLVNQVSKFAYADSANSVMTQSEMSLGQNIDFKG